METGMWRRWRVAVCRGLVWGCGFGLVAAAVLAGDRQSLSGRWRLGLDRTDVGVAEQWFSRRLPDSMALPGSLQQRGIGNPVTVGTEWTGGIVDRTWFTAPEYARYRVPGAIKVPFWLQPETVYTGVAWYQREITIPAGWSGRRTVLFLERPHWETRVWVDDRFVGSANALGTPHEHDLGVLTPGSHRLTVRVDNRRVVDIGENSHSLSDHTQGNWNGLVGRLELQSTPTVWVDDVQVYPDVPTRSALVRWKMGNATGGTVSVSTVCRILAGAQGGQVVAERTIDAQVPFGVGEGSVRLDLGDACRLWEEFSPNLFRASVSTRTPAGEEHGRDVVFGMSAFRTEGTRFTINGRPVFLRGTLECSIFPKTGHPPTDVASWRKVMRAAKDHGLNHLRFHSHCPPEAAFEAADELGLYLQVEASSWANQSTTLGDGKPVDDWVYGETARILKHYGNHPSFVLMAYGNEPAGPRHGEYLSRWVAHFKALDPRRLWTSAAGWPQLPVNEWHSSPDPRVQAWGAGLGSRLNAKPPETTTDYRDYIAARPVPVVSHEIGQWCVYPNFAEKRKYTGYLKPRNFEIFEDTLKANGLGALAGRFLFASGRLQTLCYKEDIESALRTPGMGGFQLLDLHDFPGQGTALVGVLDPFWEGKGYVTPAAFRRFCGPTVPLARLARRVFTTQERLEADVEVAHFGTSAFVPDRASWALISDREKVVAAGEFERREIPVGNGIALGHVTISLGSVPAPARYRLAVTLEGVTQAENDWDIWVYPPAEAVEASSVVRVVSDLDAEAAAELERGGRVLWLVPPARVRPDAKRGPVALGFTSIFWNTAWTGGQAPHTLGILCDPGHPALGSFPTDGFSNWQWWYLVSKAGAMDLRGLPPRLDPVVRVIDDWVTARSLALAFEARVGTGRLFVCSVDLGQDSGAELDPVRRQFRASLMRYLAGDRFRPGRSVSLAEARSVAVGSTTDDGMSARSPSAVR